MTHGSFNQDPVENFFSCKRRHGVRNTRPICLFFVSSTKAIVINGFASSHSVGVNCEPDEWLGVLSLFLPV